MFKRKTSPTRVSNLVVRWRPIADLKFDPKNARVHTRTQIQKIARSIEEFGFCVPVLVNFEGGIVAGAGRVEAGRLLELPEVPTITLEHLSAAQARGFMLADNRLSEIASWDEHLLGQQFKELAELELEFDLEVTGFEMGEIDILVQGLNFPAEDLEDEIPDPAGKVEVCRMGDLWILGPHRLLCGDAREPASLQALMQGEGAAMVFTDPPYNVPIVGNVSGKGTIKHQDFAMACGEMSELEFTEFLTQSLACAAKHCLDGAIVFVAMDWRHLGELLAAGKAVFSELKNICVWAKDRAGMGTFYRSQHEFFFVFKHGTVPHRNNFGLGEFGRFRTNVWTYPSAVSFGRSNEEGDLLRLHPTVKPVKLISDAILDCSARGDIVLDPFLGSGTTIIAAERVGRLCFGIEISPSYTDTIIRRWQAFTGGHAVHALSEKRFSELEERAQR